MRSSLLADALGATGVLASWPPGQARLPRRCGRMFAVRGAGARRGPGRLVVLRRRGRPPTSPARWATRLYYRYLRRRAPSLVVRPRYMGFYPLAFAALFLMAAGPGAAADAGHLAGLLRHRAHRRGVRRRVRPRRPAAHGRRQLRRRRHQRRLPGRGPAPAEPAGRRAGGHRPRRRCRVVVARRWRGALRGDRHGLRLPGRAGHVRRSAARWTPAGASPSSASGWPPAGPTRRRHANRPEASRRARRPRRCAPRRLACSSAATSAAATRWRAGWPSAPSWPRWPARPLTFREVRGWPTAGGRPGPTS